MKITDRTAHTLVLEDRPSMLSLLSYSLIGVGLILILGDFYEHVERQTLFWVGLLIGMVGLLGAIRYQEYTRSVFDKTQNKLVIHRKPPFRKVSAESYLLSEIGQIQIEAKDGKQGVFRLALSLEDESWVPLARKANSSYAECESLAKRIQLFLAPE